jgi:hypothetical protein
MDNLAAAIADPPADVLAEKLPLKLRRFCDQYARQGFTNPGAAYRFVNPKAAFETSRTKAYDYLKKPQVQAYLQTLSPPLSSQEAGAIKKTFLEKVNRITGKAENAEQYSAALKGCELEAKVEGLFSQEDNETNQYMQFFDKVSIVVNQGGEARIAQTRPPQVLSEMKIIEGSVETMDSAGL